MNTKHHIIALLLGIAYLFAVIWPIGLGAAIAIPAQWLAPWVQETPILAFAVVNLVSLGLPMLLVLVPLVLILRYCWAPEGRLPYLLLLVPFLVMELYYLLVMPMLTGQSPLFSLGTNLPKDLVLVLATLALARLLRPKPGFQAGTA